MKGGLFMTEDEKIEVAVFRFSVISDFVNGMQMSREEKRRLLRDKCARKWNIPFSAKTRISKNTVRRWIRLYTNSNGKLESLYPHDRADRGKSRGMDEDTCLSLIRLRKEFPTATIPYLTGKMKQRGMVPPGCTLNLSTVYRFLHHHNLMEQNKHKPVDRRKYEAELPNDLWQSDVMHGPKVEVKGKMRKSYLIAFIDDHSRLVPYGEFYLSEAVGSYLDAFEKALSKRGLPRKLYVDNGPAFRSKHLEQITASLNIALIHSKPYQPQGRGKIERFFRTVRSGFLTDCKSKSLDDLNERFDNWLNGIYHQRKHSATGQTPFKRFTSKMECLRAAPENLALYFRKAARRKVAKDRTITLNGRLYEAPVPLIGKQVQLLYHEHDMRQVEALWDQKSYGFLTPVDLHVNCRVKRDKNNNIQIDDESTSYQGGKLWASKRIYDDER